MPHHETTKKKQPEPEVDPRFPSGEWKGFWLQRGLEGRQWMKLVLEFVNGHITGEGRDWVGEFDIRGAYHLDDGRCAITKSYPGSHTVSYAGANEGDGKWLWGLWKIQFETGGFHLWPKGEPDPTGSDLSAANPLPRERVVLRDLIPV